MPEETPRAEATEPEGVRFQNRAFSGRQAIRELRAAAPGRDPDALRGAYLDVLKLCLCDLGGKSTNSVWKDKRGVVMSRELEGEELQVRALGVDWPLQGLTMVGLHRLDDLQACVETIVREGVEGDLIEAGTWRGGASILMRASLDALGADERCVWVADSFDGFPVPDERHPDTGDLAAIGFLAVPMEEVRDNFARFGFDRGVRFVPGFFQETMPGLTDQRWSLVRLDGDSYEATWMTLESLYPDLSVGGYLVVDDYGALGECQQAVDEFRRRHGISEPLEQVDWTSVHWRRTDPTPIERPVAAGRELAANGRKPARVAPATPARIPTIHELGVAREKQALSHEIAEVRERLAAAEVEIELLHGSPLRGPRAWLGRKLQRARSRP